MSNGGELIVCAFEHCPRSLEADTFDIRTGAHSDMFLEQATEVANAEIRTIRHWPATNDPTMDAGQQRPLLLARTHSSLLVPLSTC
jgi:hypothetical protein